MKVIKTLTIMLLLYSTFVFAQGEAQIEAAKGFFQTYLRLEQVFDPAVAGLYSDNAHIINIRKYPFGRERKMGLTGSQYKKLLVKFLPLASRNKINGNYCGSFFYGNFR